MVLKGSISVPYCRFAHTHPFHSIGSDRIKRTAGGHIAVLPRAVSLCHSRPMVIIITRRLVFVNRHHFCRLDWPPNGESSAYALVANEN